MIKKKREVSTQQNTVCSGGSRSMSGYAVYPMVGSLIYAKQSMISPIKCKLHKMWGVLYTPSQCGHLCQMTQVWFWTKRKRFSAKADIFPTLQNNFCRHSPNNCFSVVLRLRFISHFSTKTFAAQLECDVLG